MNISSKLVKYWLAVLVPSILLALIVTGGDFASFLLVLCLSGVFLGGAAYFLWINREKEYDLSFPLKPGEDNRLNVKWKGMYKNISVRMDGMLAGTLEKLDKRGMGKVLLPNGSELSIKPATHPFLLYRYHLELEINGSPVPGSVGDPIFELNNAALAIGLGGVLTLIMPFFDQSISFLVSFILFLVSILCAVLLRRRSRAGLWLGVVLVLLSLLSLIAGILATDGVELLDLFADVIEFSLYGIGLVKSYSGLRKLKVVTPLV